MRDWCIGAEAGAVTGARIPNCESGYWREDAERYTDFGPTLAAEPLDREGLREDDDTLRRWLLAQGTPESVQQTAVETLQAVKAAGHPRFVLSSGCTLAVETPTENLDALFSSAQDAPP
jgi:hypothetical protein